MCHKKGGKVMQKQAETEGSLANSQFLLAHLFKCTVVCQKKNECDSSKKDCCMLNMANTY
jgi:hypothetical protein